PHAGAVYARALVVIGPVSHADPVEPGAKVEKDPLVSSSLPFASQQAAHDPPRITIERQPAVPFGLFVENVQHSRWRASPPPVACRLSIQIPPDNRRGESNPNLSATRASSRSPSS